MDFSVFTGMCRASLVNLRTRHPLKRKLCTLSLAPPSAATSPRLGISRKWPQNGVFRDWLLPLSVMFSRFIHTVQVSLLNYFLRPSNIPLHGSLLTMVNKAVINTGV